MKCVKLTIVVLLMATATMILHAASEPEKGAKTYELMTATPTVTPVRNEVIPKRLTAGHMSPQEQPTQAPTKLVLEKTTISPSAVSLHTFTEPTTGMQFLPVPGGCFQMGDNNGDADEKPAHQVCLDDYYIGKYEVTQGQWLKLMGSSPSFFSSCGENCPVESVNWNETQAFISKLNSLNGRTYRLLTEAEWEYACRSGGKNERYCGGDDVNAIAWLDKNSQSQPHPVGAKQPNALGIYDMSGNIWEWVSDFYLKNYYSNAPQNNPEGPATGPKRVMRGGSWYNDLRNVRARIRSGDEPDHRSINLGFRVACSANYAATPSR
jgi:formylglycine-generating enzyme required for sulfatase activity